MALRFGCNRRLRTGAVLHVSGFFKSTWSNPEPGEIASPFLTKPYVHDNISPPWQSKRLACCPRWSMRTWQSRLWFFSLFSVGNQRYGGYHRFLSMGFSSFFHFQEQRLPTVVRPALMQFKSAMEIVLHSDSSWDQISSVRLRLSQ